MATNEPPAARLLGMDLPDGWKVTGQMDKLARRAAGLSGGNFSHGYTVTNQDGRRAFLKAFDYVTPLSRLNGSNPADVLNFLTAGYIHERDLLKKCGESGLDRVVRALGEGTVSIEPGSPFGVVSYLILELADADVRSYASASEAIDHAWALRTLHQAAVGLQQLHSKGIVHQDIKPSNVMTFGPAGAKLGDLGRASEQGKAAPHSEFPVAGDPVYAPPELRYNEASGEWAFRNVGCDLYLLGSLGAFLVAGASVTALILGNLRPELQPGIWGGTYEEIFPFVKDAFAKGMLAIEGDIPAWCRTELGTALRQLCDPEVNRRGHPKQMGNPQTQMMLGRYVTLFDLLAGKAENRMRASLK